MKKLTTVIVIASLALCSTGVFAKTKPKPIYAQNGNMAIQSSIFAGYDVKGKSVVHIKLSNFQPYTAKCEILDKKTKATAKMEITPGKTFWINDATVPFTFDVKCKVKGDKK